MCYECDKKEKHVDAAWTTLCHHKTGRGGDVRAMQIIMLSFGGLLEPLVDKDTVDGATTT